MSRGCCLGCLGLLLVLAIVLGGGLFLADRAFNVFRPAERVDLAAAYGVDHAVVARLDLSSEYLQEITGRAVGSQPWIVELFWPHEVFLVMDMNTELNVRDLTLAVSTRRFGGFLSTWLPLGDNVDVGGGYVVRNVGLSADGVLRVVASGELGEEVQATTAAWTDNVEPYTFQREYLFEFLVNNNGGAGYAALKTWFEIDEKHIPLEERALSPEEAEELLQNIGAFRMTADIVDDGTMEVVIESRSVDEEKAARVLTHLDTIFAHLKSVLEEKPGEMEGEFVLDGDEVRGEFLFIDLDETMIETSRDVLEEIEQR